ncbi:MAG: retroviral-like aspartic protease family protein [Anaerolineae bacterium]|nr:retroviral-like aspartic protease family protein [Anaerolineae bacterium]
MKQCPYVTSYHPSFPAMEVVLQNSENDLHTATLSALLDTGADGTLVPLTYLREILAPPLTEVRLRSHWGEWRTAQLYLVEIRMAELTLTNVFVVGDEQGEEVVLGRDVLNRLILVLDGPAAMTTLR